MFLRNHLAGTLTLKPAVINHMSIAVEQDLDQLKKVHLDTFNSVVDALPTTCTAPVTTRKDVYSPEINPCPALMKVKTLSALRFAVAILGTILGMLLLFVATYLYIQLRRRKVNEPKHERTGCKALSGKRPSHDDDD